MTPLADPLPCEGRGRGKILAGFAPQGPVTLTRHSHGQWCPKGMESRLHCRSGARRDFSLHCGQASRQADRQEGIRQLHSPATLLAQPGPARIGINAALVSRTRSYRSAGISHYLFSLLRALRDLDAPEQIVAYFGPGLIPSEVAATPRFSALPARVPTNRPLARIAWEQLALPQHLKRDRVALLHSGTHAIPFAWRGPSLLTIYDLSFLLFPGVFRRANRTYLHWMVRYSARRADRVLAISDSTARDVQRLLGVAPERILRIYPGIDEQFKPIEDRRVVYEFRQRRSLPEHFILCLATIEPRKNLIRLMDAYARIRQAGKHTYPLVLAGGTGPGHDAIARHVEELGLADSIRFGGYVPEDEKPLWYNAARLFVYPSLYEGFGLPVLEAIACGTPVITGNRSSLPEVLGDAGIVVDPEDVEHIAEAIGRGLDDDSFRERSLTEGPRQARQFSWRHAAEEHLRVYREVLDSR